MSENSDLLNGKFSTMCFIDRIYVSRTGTVVRVDNNGVLFKEHGYRKTADSREFFIRNEDIVSLQQATEKEIAEVLLRESEGEKRPPGRRVRKYPPRTLKPSTPEELEKKLESRAKKKEAPVPDPDFDEEEDTTSLTEDELNNEDDFEDEEDWED